MHWILQGLVRRNLVRCTYRDFGEGPLCVDTGEVRLQLLDALFRRLGLGLGLLDLHITKVIERKDLVWVRIQTTNLDGSNIDV